MIRLSHVYKSYGEGFHALIDISLHIPKGDFVFVTGPSGAGKTTLIKLLYRGEEADRGQILIDGQNIARLPPGDVPLLRRRIGVVFQDFKLLGRRTVFENVALAQRALGVRPGEMRRRVRFILNKVGLGSKMEDYPEQLSGGECQRVAVARAIVNRPALLLADEPTGNLDPDTAQDMMDLLSRIHLEGTTILVATHDTDRAARLGRPIYRLQGGRLLSDGDGRP